LAADFGHPIDIHRKVGLQGKVEKTGMGEWIWSLAFNLELITIDLFLFAFLLIVIIIIIIELNFSW